MSGEHWRIDKFILNEQSSMTSHLSHLGMKHMCDETCHLMSFILVTRCVILKVMDRHMLLAFEDAVQCLTSYHANSHEGLTLTFHRLIFKPVESFLSPLDVCGVHCSSAFTKAITKIRKIIQDLALGDLLLAYLSHVQS